MAISHIQDDEASVDGQTFVIPSIESLHRLLHEPNYLGIPVYLPGTETLVKNLILFVSEHWDEFRLGVYRAEHLKKAWMVVPLFAVGNNWQRVQIERVTCEKCAWNGWIANPTEPSLYFGVPNELAATQHAYTYSRLGCPACEIALPRFAVWTESIIRKSGETKLS